ncbi:MAG: FAD-dependent oxidoreductase, partial [Armatimonadota bacterium]|nr:FAD-dependent oxidoreductase [Armatimonadota bacterium]
MSTNNSFDYDLIILGGGSAGIVSGVMAGSLGLRVLLIEKRKMGGECLNTGCVPSKALIHAAKVARLMGRAGDIGLRAAPLDRSDASGVLRHVRDSIDTVREADATEQLLRDAGVEIRIGEAHFQDEDTLLYEGQPLRADHFILATGSRPA